MLKQLIILCLSLLVISCKAGFIPKKEKYITTQNIALGTVGEYKNVFFKKDYNRIALPKYQNPIKVKVNVQPFKKSSLKAYNNAKEFQNANLGIGIKLDSITRPTYLTLEISDRVAVLNSLNHDSNNDVFQFLQNKNNAHVITGLTIAFSNELITFLAKAEEVFLEHNGINSYVLKIYKNKLLQNTIYFNKGVVFGYTKSTACWKTNKRHQLEIADIVSNNEKCSKNTYKSTRKHLRLKRKINTY